MNISFVVSLVAATTTTAPDISILTYQVYVEQCKQLVAITDALSVLVMAPLNVLGMFAMFTKLEKTFNPSRIAANI